MSEITWVMVLGGIAIAFPIVLVLFMTQINPDFNIKEEIFDVEIYQNIINMTKDNFNYTYLKDNEDYFINQGIFGFPSEFVFNLNFFLFGDEGFQKWKLNNLKIQGDYTEVESGKISKITSYLGIQKFYFALKLLPYDLYFFIITLYGLLFVYLGIKAVTLL